MDHLDFELKTFFCMDLEKKVPKDVNAEYM